MKTPMTQRHRITSGVKQLDRLLDGLYIGDNVIWLDDSGNLAYVFCLNFIRESQAANKPVIYISFDRSIKNLLEKLGRLADNPALTILDCFSCGKGARSSIFLRFYEDLEPRWPCRIKRVENPQNINEFMDVLYKTHSTMNGDVRLVFESITGMQEVWGGEEQLLSFYSHSCPRLYELNTIAYWIMEKMAHTARLRARISQIAQVVIGLSIKRGTTSLTIYKAENRSMENFHKPFIYWTKDSKVEFATEKGAPWGIDLGQKIKEFRTKRGLSQTELAKLVGVTPSSISQVESNLIYPSLPGLLKMAEILGVEVSSFFRERGEPNKRIVFRGNDAVEVKLIEAADKGIFGKLLTPVDFQSRAEPYLIEIPPEKTLSSHFFVHKGDEMGYLLSGTLELKLGEKLYTARSGDLIYLTVEIPSEWKNPGPQTAKLLWLKIRP